MKYNKSNFWLYLMIIFGNNKLVSVTNVDQDQRDMS
jgi:hypothetical protein